MFFNAPTTTIANPKMRDFIRARREMSVMIGGMRVTPSLREGLTMLRTGVALPVSETAKVAARAEALKMDRFKVFCEDSGIVNCEKFNPERGVIEIFVPDAMGYPTHVMDMCPETGELLD